jgi:predicted nucleic acid-binding protein
VSCRDRSALVKLYLPETDSLTFENLALHANRIVTANVAKFEAHTVFRRCEAESSLISGKAKILYQELIANMSTGEIDVIEDMTDIEREYGGVLEACFSRSPPIFVRTLDALHLAAASVAGETEFVTADIRQKAAALALGFQVL